MDSIELMRLGEAAMKGGRLEEAEQLLQQATRIENWRSGKPTGAFEVLGDVRWKRGNHNGAITSYRQALPDRGACRGLIRCYREYAKQASDDPKACLRWYNHMLSAAWLYWIWTDLKRRNPALGDAEHRRLWKQWVTPIQEKNRTLFGFTYAVEVAPPDDKLLTQSDYKKLHKLTFGGK